jgi:hypothetical protein
VPARPVERLFRADFDLRDFTMNKVTVVTACMLAIGLPALTYVLSKSNHDAPTFTTSDFLEPRFSDPFIASSVSTPVVTRSQFERIRSGMSYSQVSGIIGVSGEETASSRIEAIPGVTEAVETRMYQWINADGSNMNTVFQNDQLIQKAQFGLK